MSKSVMIEVDETTKSILDLIEGRMTRGTEATLESFRTESNQALQQVSTQMNNQLQEIAKNITRDSSRVDRRLEDLYEDIEDLIEKKNKELHESQQKTYQKGYSELATSFKEDTTALSEALNMTEESFSIQFVKLKEDIDNKIFSLENEMKNKLEGISVQQQEQHIQLVNTITEKLSNVELIHTLVEKIDNLEKELRWTNLPFYKRWFRKRV